MEKLELRMKRKFTIWDKQSTITNLVDWSKLSKSLKIKFVKQSKQSSLISSSWISRTENSFKIWNRNSLFWKSFKFFVINLIINLLIEKFLSLRFYEIESITIMQWWANFSEQGPHQWVVIRVANREIKFREK